MKIIKGIVAILGVLGILLGVVSGCQKTSEELSKNNEREPTTLKVYVLGDTIFGENEQGKMGPLYFYSGVAIGEYSYYRHTYGNDGHMFYQALKEYDNQSQDQLDIEWFPYPEEIRERLKQDEKNHTMPDVILSNFTSAEDYKRWMKAGLFYDLTDFLETDDLYDTDKYNQTILDGGKLDGKQYMLPYLYTMDTLMGSEEIMREYNLNLKGEMSAEEILTILENNLNEKQDLAEYETIGQMNAVVGYYTLHMLYGAMGEESLNYDNGNVNLDQELFNHLATVCQLYLKQELGEKQEVLPTKTIEDLNLLWQKAKIVETSILSGQDMDAALDREGCIIEGGYSYNPSLHSFAAQANYYESRYQDRNETFWMTGIPEWGKDDVYSAHISSFGVVMSSCKAPQAAYELLRYLLDVKQFRFNGIPVNQELAKQMLDELCETEYGISRISGMVPEDEWEKNESNCYWIHPMSQKTRDIIEKMMEKVGNVTVPNWPVYYCIYQPITEYSMDRMTLEEAYEKAVQNLKEYSLEHIG